MNKIVLLGRLTRDPELKLKENTDIKYVKFDLAVERKFKSDEPHGDVDFIPVIAWAKNAETIHKYFSKGDFISLSGRLLVSSYEDKEGVKRHSTNVVLEEFRFVGANKNNKNDQMGNNSLSV